MSLRIIEHRKNPLMKMDEVRAAVEHAGKPTPRRDDLLPSLENVLKTSRDLILIDKIFTKKGKGESLLKVFVYERKEDMPKHDLQKAEKRKMKGEAKAGPAEEKKEAGEKKS